MHFNNKHQIEKALENKYKYMHDLNTKMNN